MQKSKFPDPFEQAREETGIGKMIDQDDPVMMVLRHKDVRRCAHNWQDFQSGAIPGRIVVPSEVNIRNTRQIPFEVDPPMHGAYRALLEDWFRRPLEKAYQKELKTQIDSALEAALTKGRVEVVSEFALPVQSRALTLLLNVPIEEAETWISWGTHVFRSEETALDADKATILYKYIDEAIEKADANPGLDLYSQLLTSKLDDRFLNKEEVKGVMVLTFAGGRDTVINAITNTIVYFSEHPGAFDQLRNNPEVVSRAVEELIRFFSPLTHMGRVVTKDTQVCAHAVQADSRISLCWASANRDATVFENPNEVMLDRQINPHVGFGFSHHKCLGATHARQVLKTLINGLIEKIGSIKIVDGTEKIEQWGDFERKVGFDEVQVQFSKKKQ